MKAPSKLAAAAVMAASLAQSALAQEPLMYKHEETGIEFATWSQDHISPEGDSGGQPGYLFGIALPKDAMDKPAKEYIGILKCTSTSEDGKGWCGFSHGQSGQMTNALLLVAYPWGNEVYTSLRFAMTYAMPDVYMGDAKVTQISSKVTDEGFEVVYRCQNCFSWEQDGISGEVSTTEGFIVGGRAQSKFLPEGGECPDTMVLGFHADGFGQWGASIEKAVNAKYDQWAAMATKTVKGKCGDAEPEIKPTPATPPKVSTPAPAEPVKTGDKGQGEAVNERPTRGGARPSDGAAARPERPERPQPSSRPERPVSSPSGDDDDEPARKKNPSRTSPARIPSAPKKTTVRRPYPWSRPTPIRRPWRPSRPLIPTVPSRPSARPTPARPERPASSVRPARPETPAPLPPVPADDDDEKKKPTPPATEQKPPVVDKEQPADKTEDKAPAAAKCDAVGDETFDYIVVGAGAGGIPMADRLSEAGHKVLLIEKGPVSSHRWGGTMKPEWLEGQPLTRFDVPGLCNQIWHDATGIVCTDMDQIAGCVLGGGTAVNAGLWWKPHPDDWNYNFPTGWKADDLVAATNRVFTRIPGTTHPSMDGILYQDEGFQVLKAGLSDAGWKFIPNSNDSPSEKNKVFAHTTFMFSGGERSGPLATYLVTASRRKNFQLWTNTAVKRVVRSGSRITGVEVECNEGGRQGTIKVAPTGRVVLSAGTFGTAKLLFRSGIGPADQLKVVQEAETMLSTQDSWINLPVGENLMDHLNTDVVVEHPDVFQYNYTAAWWDPDPADAKMYLQDRSGILAAAAPNIGPMIWDQIKGSDGITRQLQWTSRMEGSLDFVPNNHSITMSQYLGRGVVSRGRMTISPYLSTMVSTLPYLRNDGDREAVIQGLENIRKALKGVPGLKFLSPADNITSEKYVDDYVVSVGRRSNHWMGTAKMGTDDGRKGGTAVVDANNKVYGTDNLFVMDASIFPGMMTGNPSAMIVIASEHASQRILALPATAASETKDTKDTKDVEAKIEKDLTDAVDGQMKEIEIESPPEVEFEFGDN